MTKAAYAKLSTYRQKRDFDKTAEPDGAEPHKPQQRLVVQQHFARRLHFDLRLEIDGVLVSWAVTRGPSANPRDKRLAVRTEDHPLAYATFEGLIPKPQYGGGTVMLWESGTYAPLNGPARDELAAGHLKFAAHGHRMQGAWALVRMKSEEKHENWLLIKDRDEFAEPDDSIATRYTTGVLSGLSRDQIENTQAVRKVTPSDPVKKTSTLPAFISPQLCTMAQEVPIGSDWAFEMKYDGYRLLLAANNGEARVYTRSGLDWSHKFSHIIKAAIELDLAECLLDGEAVVFDKGGISDFPALVAALERKKTSDVVFVAFDALIIGGEDLRSLPYADRKARLRKALPATSDILRYGNHTTNDGEKLFKEATKAVAEGIIAKRLSAPYRSGRSNEWLKIKGDVRDDVEIIGYMPSRKHGGFASLLAARKVKGRLAYVGRIGAGYNGKNRPVIEKLFGKPSKSVPDVMNAQKLPRGAVFTHPPFSSEVRFGGWTSDGQLRQARFIAVQTDRVTVPKPSFTIAKAKAKNAGAAKQSQSPSSWTITHPERILFPADRITKGDIAEYYKKIASDIIPHLAGRPLSLLRAPESIDHETFFQRHPLKGLTKGVEQFGSASEKYFALSGEVGLAAAVQFGTIELHGWNATLPTLDKPDRMIFDLDPDTEIPFKDVQAAASLLRNFLQAAQLESWPLLSGGKGIHIVVPLDRSNSSDDVEVFCKQFAKRIADEKPELFVANMSLAKRKGKIFIDYLRNRTKATAVVPWSVRARPRAPIAAPVSWNQLEAIKQPNEFTIRHFPENNNWKTFWTTRQSISPHVIKLLNRSRDHAMMK